MLPHCHLHSTQLSLRVQMLSITPSSDGGSVRRSHDVVAWPPVHSQRGWLATRVARDMNHDTPATVRLFECVAGKTCDAHLSACLTLAHHECNRRGVQHAGSTPATRKAAAEQLGEVVRLQPHELHRLLARIHPYLRSKTWDTRIAAGQACVQSHTDPSRSFARACACHDIF